MQDRTNDNCAYCHAPGPFHADACYGCIKLRELALTLASINTQLDALLNDTLKEYLHD